MCVWRVYKVPAVDLLLLIYEAFSLFPGTEMFPFTGRWRKSTDLKILFLLLASASKSEIWILQKFKSKYRVQVEVLINYDGFTLYLKIILKNMPYDVMLWKKIPSPIYYYYDNQFTPRDTARLKICGHKCFIFFLIFFW